MKDKVLIIRKTGVVVTALVGITSFVILLCSCDKLKKSMQTTPSYSWGASVTSAESYPIEIHTGYLATKKEFITAFVNNGVEENGWQDDGTGTGAGGRIIPTLVSLTWVSYAEKKFWKLDEGKLDAKLIESLFQKGFDNYESGQDPKGLVHETYNHITVAVAPGGVVAVFLTGRQHRTQVARFQAVETVVTPNEFYDNPHNRNQQEFFDKLYEITVSPEKRAEIETKGIPYGIWTKYESKFNWRFVPVFYKEDKFIDTRNLYFNGEKEYVFETELTEKKYYNKPLPYKCGLHFKTRWFHPVFDWEELYNACIALTAKDKNTPLDIIAKVDFEYKRVIYSVTNGEQTIPLPKAVDESEKGGN